MERARRRLAVAEEDVAKALRVKSTREFQLEQGLAKLEKLREEAVAQPDHPVGGVVPHEDELSRLRARVAELEAQRAGSHHATDPPATIPAQSAEEINLLRATVAELRRERTSLLSEVARQTDVSGGTRIETLIDDAELDSRISQRFAPY